MMRQGYKGEELRELLVNMVVRVSPSPHKSQQLKPFLPQVGAPEFLTNVIGAWGEAGLVAPNSREIAVVLRPPSCGCNASLSPSAVTLTSHTEHRETETFFEGPFIILLVNGFGAADAAPTAMFIYLGFRGTVRVSFATLRGVSSGTTAVAVEGPELFGDGVTGFIAWFGHEIWTSCRLGDPELL